MAVNPGLILSELLTDFVDGVAELDRASAQCNCEILKSQLYDDDGSVNMTTVHMKDSDGGMHEVQLPAVSLVPPSLLYIPEISFELTGSDVLRIYGEPLRNDDTQSLSESGQMLRKKIADFGFNSDIVISTSGHQTKLKFIIYKDGTTMTRYMEKWLEDTSQAVNIKTIESSDE